MSTQFKRMIVGVSGASGIQYAECLLQTLKRLEIETHLIMTQSAEVTLAYETDWKVADFKALADKVYRNTDIAAPPSSGSFRTMGMIVAPCSAKSLSEIAYGIGGNLLSRSADVTLKERRPLVLMVRETPLHAGHIKAMAAATDMGAIIAPPVPAFYCKPSSIADLIHHSINRTLDLFGLDAELAPRWGE
jgi:4-hydroxy-3-polyprenylbenzoate decarboxylase